MLITKQDIVKALTKEGTFFRKAIEEKFKELSWSTEKEHPYSLSRYLPEEKTLSKSIDIFARKQWIPHRNYEVDLIIECKKIDNPDSKWIFYSEDKGDFMAWNFSAHAKGIFTITLNVFRGKIVDIAYDQIILINKSKTNTSIISETSAEVAKALYGVESNRENVLSEAFDLDYTSGKQPSINEFWFMPIVVTNANLNISNFETSSNTLENGKIDDTKFEYKSVPWLVYDYPLPHYLQIMEDIPGGFTPDPYSPPYIRKIPIIFLRSNKIKEFIDFLIEK